MRKQNLSPFIESLIFFNYTTMITFVSVTVYTKMEYFQGIFVSHIKMNLKFMLTPIVISQVLIKNYFTVCVCVCVFLYI